MPEIDIEIICASFLSSCPGSICVEKFHMPVLKVIVRVALTVDDLPRHCLRLDLECLRAIFRGT